MIVVTLPYSSKLSKNCKNVGWNTGRYYKSTEKKSSASEIVYLVRQHLGEIAGAKRLYLAIVLFRKHRRTDPQNLVELLSDAVEVATGIDDCNYQISSWAVDIRQPSFFALLVTADRSEYMRVVSGEYLIPTDDGASTSRHGPHHRL